MPGISSKTFRYFKRFVLFMSSGHFFALNSFLNLLRWTLLAKDQLMCSLHRLHTCTRTVCIFLPYKSWYICRTRISFHLLFLLDLHWWSPHNLHETNFYTSRITSFCNTGLKQWQKSSPWNLVNTCFLSSLLKLKLSSGKRSL